MRYSEEFAPLCKTRKKGAGISMLQLSKISNAIRAALQSFSGMSRGCSLLLFSSAIHNLSPSFSRNMIQSLILSLHVFSPFNIIRLEIPLKLREQDCSSHLSTVDSGRTFSMCCCKDSKSFEAIVSLNLQYPYESCTFHHTGTRGLSRILPVKYLLLLSLPLLLCFLFDLV